MNAGRTVSLAASIVLSAALLFPVATWANGRNALVLDPRVRVVFRLQVSGRPTSHATFWVAYGPTAGKFGIVRLKASSNSTWLASQRLVTGARLNLVYLMGQGSVQTRFGVAPGNPVVTIRRVPSFTVGTPSPAVVQWQAPIG